MSIMPRRLAAIAVFALILVACADVPAAPPISEITGDVSPTAPPRTERGSDEDGFASVIVELPAVVVDAAPAPAPGTGLVRAGVLTAGDIDDTLNLGAFARYAATVRAETNLPLSNFANPVLAQIVGPDGAPAPGQRVTLRRPGQPEPFYDGYAGVDGRVSVFPAIFGAGRAGDVELRVYPEGLAEPVTQTIQSGAQRAVVQMPAGGPVAPGFLDLVFVLDATGSMADELEWLTSDLASIVRTATRGTGVDTRFALVVYRDYGDEYVVRSYAFTGSVWSMQATLRAQSAAGGGDYPEAADQALAAALQLPWRRGQGERLLFHIADAPPHDRDARAYLVAARDAARANIQIFGLGASGVADEFEFLMRQAAAQTGGRYLFLTDDSGVGGGHAEPRISCYRVTPLTGLLARVIRSELTGQRVEPPDSEVVREVGTYRGGVCVN